MAVAVGGFSGEEFYVLIWGMFIWGMFFWGIFIGGVIIYNHKKIPHIWGMFLYEQCLSEGFSPDAHGSCCKSWQVGECLSGEGGGRVLLNPCAQELFIFLLATLRTRVFQIVFISHTAHKSFF